MQNADNGATANGRRIAANAAVTYARSLIALLLGLFSARWVLAALGAVDFGLYAVVGSMMAFVSFFGGVLGISVARHYAFAVGGGSQKDLAAWCAAAFRVHLVLAFVLTAIAWPMGEWCVRNVMVVPLDRLEACLWTFRLALVTLFVTVSSVPFNAMYVAHQRFGKLAAFGLAQTAVMFCGAWWLRGADCDRLIAYAGYMTLAFSGVAAAQVVGAWIEFPVCRRPFAANVGGRIRSLLSFAGWSVFGTGGWIVGSHGSAFVTNRFFGAAANAAYGVSTQVQYHTEALANALVGAFEPAVTSQEGAGERTQTVRLSCRAGLLGASLLALFALPLALELPTVLALWLEEPPPYAAQVCIIMLCAAVLNKLTMGQQLALNACGQIAGWQVSVGLGQAAMLPIAAAIAFCGGGVVSAAIATATTMAICAALNVWFGWHRTGLGAGMWLRIVVVPFAAVVSLAASVGLLPRLLMAPGFLRVCVTSCATSLVFAGAAGVWWWRIRRHR
ncbi:MAG: hypothetical protein J6V72_04465 [Kiritimatiellae bacterium]|nr:hypothetical protein [Kiritimatiellia bacterium]